MNNNRGFFDSDDDFDEQATNIGGNGYQQQYPGSGMPPIDDSEMPTQLPNNNGGFFGSPGAPAGGGMGDYQPETRMPNYMDDMDEDEDFATMMGDEDQEILPLGFLIVKRPLVRRGYVYKLPPRKCKIGRKRGDIRLQTDRRVSGDHAMIKQMEDPDTGSPVFVLLDMGSTTGTFVNDSPRIDRNTRLNEGDEIKIGDHVFVFKMMAD